MELSEEIIMFFKTKEMKRILANNKKLSEKVDTMTDELDTLTTERRNLKDEIEDLKVKKKISEEDIKHMVKMREERLELQFEKKQVEADKEYQTKLHNMSNTYRDKAEKQLEKESKDMKDMYGQVLERLPNVTARLTGDI